MMPESVSVHSGLSQKIISAKPTVARAITDEFFLKHPDWIQRYGESGRQHCTADACFHLDFLAGAIDAGSPQAFADYMRWTARMLGARGIAAHTLEENLTLLGNHLALLLPQEHEPLSMFLMQARQAYSAPETLCGM